MNKSILASLTTAAVSLGILLAAPQAHATLILSGNSDSSSFTNCVGPGCPSGPSQTITLGSTAPGGGNSVLSILPDSFSASAPTTGLVLAELSLSVGNKPGTGEGALAFDYNIVLTFTGPGGSQSTTLYSSLSGSGGSGSNGKVTLSGLMPHFSDPLMLSANLSLTNFRFVDVGSSGSFADGTWTINRADSPVTLELLADLVDPPTPVPEPSSIALIGAALAGLGIARCKRRSV